MQKIIIILGVLFIIIGVLFPYISKIGLFKRVRPQIDVTIA